MRFLLDCRPARTSNKHLHVDVKVEMEDGDGKKAFATCGMFVMLHEEWTVLKRTIMSSTATVGPGTALRNGFDAIEFKEEW